MTTARLWYQGARPKTLGAAISPVLVGTAAGSLDGPIDWPRAAAAAVVALALQVGVNFANDYSDGVRGTDAQRRGPVRLTATGLATPRAVQRAALLSFALAAVVGAALSIVVEPWLLLIGLAAIVAAATYTGGPRPYGYIGLGEVMVLVFFGFVATVGSAYVQHATVPGVAWVAALAAGLPACGILLANNVRDVDTDRVSGKRTLAVRLGAERARGLYVVCVAGAIIAVVACGAFVPTALLALLALPVAVAPVRAMLTRRDPPGLIAALIGTVRFQLVLSALLAIGLWAG
ncbi:MAG: 1,4-dihydroxy-2-naphthoate polyprenyltransferase [Actinomycetota bacterium]|nr:1,4-dihydroxy-2-naphthoate polyprenyltransferase [Actinomycetota bacterium]